ncbi:MAG TPA: peptidase [Kiritimatiellia bacterium]|nr:peptidase [Kiritimatiellia bacterium]
MTDARPDPAAAEALLRGLPDCVRAAEALREQLLANLVLVGEIPAPTFSEAARVDTLLMRWSESGLLNCSRDAMGNGAGVLPGADGARNILLVTHADSVFDESIDHAITVQPDSISGVGIAENALALAALATLPALLDHLKIKLRANLIFLAAGRSLGRGNLEGLRHFLANTSMPIDFGLCLEGTPIGRLSYQSIGMRRGEIHCRVPPEYNWTRFGASGAVLTINQVIMRIAAIPLPRRPVVSIVLGSLEAGHTYDHVATQAVMRFEVLGESSAMVQQVSGHFADIVAEVGAQSGAHLDLDIFAQREPGGIPIGHPLVRMGRHVVEALGAPLQITPDTAELSALIDRKIPALTIGLTTGGTVDDEHEQANIRPLYQGMAQLVTLLQAMDGGLCDEV